MQTLFLSSLETSNFRNLAPFRIDFTDRFNVISGQNGSGKTNLLEAIYFFSTMRSFRTLYRKEILQDSESEASLHGIFSGAGAGLSLDIRLTNTSRKIKKDQKELSSLVDHFYNLPMVLFHPANMSLVQGGPRDRRRFMDRALFQADRSYPALLSDYNRALSSRNALLKTRPSDPSILFPYDKQLSNLGSRIVVARRTFIEQAQYYFSDAMLHIGGSLQGSMIYRPDIPGDEVDYLRLLQTSCSKDLDRGFTRRGPHADDLEVVVSQKPAKKYASQGQQRMAVLSMKISEVMTLANVTNRIPILLLDDLSSELDRERNQSFFSFLNKVGGQVFITTTHIDHVRLSNQRSDFLINAGSIKPL